MCGRVYRLECCRNAEPSLKPKMTRKHHKCSPPSFPLILESNKHFITSPPVCCIHVVYSVYFAFEASAFWHEQCELPLQVVVKVTVRRLY